MALGDQWRQYFQLFCPESFDVTARKCSVDDFRCLMEKESEVEDFLSGQKYSVNKLEEVGSRA